MSNELAVAELNARARRVRAALRLALRIGLGVPALSALVAACGDGDKAPPYTSVGDGDGRDGGARDAASSLVDAGNYDHVIRAGDLELCGFDDRDALELPGNADRPEVAITAGDQGFALVFHAAEGELFSVDVPVGAQAQAPLQVAGTGKAVGAAAVASFDQHVLLAFRGEGDDAAVLSVRDLHADEDQPATELSDALAKSPSGGELFALLARDDDFVAAFVERDGKDDALRVQRIDASGASDGDAAAIDGVGAREPEDLHLARLDDGALLVAWFERDDAGDGHVMSVVLSSDLGDPTQPSELSQYAVADARFDLAARRLSAGLVYQAKDGDTRDAVKVRRVDGDGQVSAAAFNVVHAPGRAAGGSIAAFGQGYAVAYRALPSLGVDTPAIRVAFIDQFGAIVYEAELDTTSEQGGRTTLAATADGHLLVGWTHVAVTTPVTRGLQLYCPGALRLCGGEVE